MLLLEAEAYDQAPGALPKVHPVRLLDGKNQDIQAEDRPPHRANEPLRHLDSKLQLTRQYQLPQRHSGLIWPPIPHEAPAQQARQFIVKQERRRCKKKERQDASHYQSIAAAKDPQEPQILAPSQQKQQLTPDWQAANVGLLDEKACAQSAKKASPIADPNEIAVLARNGARQER